MTQRRIGPVGGPRRFGCRDGRPIPGAAGGGQRAGSLGARFAFNRGMPKSAIPLPNTFDPAAFVDVALPAVGLRLDAEQRKAVVAAFTLMTKIGAPALEYQVSTEAGVAPVFHP